MAMQTTISEVTTIAKSNILDLRARIRGSMLEPGDDDYDDARRVRNGLIDRRPAIIVRCSGPADVVEAVNFARTQDLLLSTRGGGHNVAGNAVNDGGLVVDLSLMRGVRVDPVNRTARVEGGATWADVDRETQLFGLATPGGAVSSTGVGGLTLHGGFSSIRRKYGLTLDNLISVDIVTADGQLLTASETEHPDLFWAVCGAGSNFGVVTSFEFQLHHIGPLIAAATPVYAFEDSATLLPAWRDFMASAPDEVSSEVYFWSIPAIEDFPQELHHRPIVVLNAVYAGAADEGEQVMRPLREFAAPLLDLSETLPYTAVQQAFDPFFPQGWFYYWKSLYLDTLDAPSLDAMVEFAATRPAPQALMALWHLGGAMNRIPAESTAFGRRDTSYLLSFDTTWNDSGISDRCVQWTRDAWSAMHRFSRGGLYLNFAGFGEEKEALLRAAYCDNYERLVELKRKYDPTNLFRMNLNIRPNS